MVKVPPRGYFLGYNKIILVMYPQNILKAETLFRGSGLQVVTGIRYLGGFVGM